jgi:hypothetical protein
LVSKTEFGLTAQGRSTMGAAFSSEPMVPGLYPPRNRFPLILDQPDRNPRGQRLADAILRSFASLDRAVKGNAQVGAGLDHLPVALGPRDVAQALPVCQVWFGHDTERTASRCERVINAWHPTVDDDQLGTVSREQPIDYLLCELIASPVPIARNQDTHVQIIASVRSRFQTAPGGSWGVSSDGTENWSKIVIRRVFPGEFRHP